MKVGDKLYQYGAFGYRRNVEPVLKEFIVCRETRRSWFIAESYFAGFDGRGLDQVPDRVMTRYDKSDVNTAKWPYRETPQATKAEYEERQFCWKHRYKIAGAVERIDDAAKLRQIAAIIGYNIEEPNQ